MNEGKPLLPIRIVQPSNDYFHQKEGGGGPVKYFIDEAHFNEHTNRLANEIKNIQKELQDNFNEFPDLPNVIKIKLNDKALAKSNRPKKLLDKDTCPIIGHGQIGEILLSATNEGLKKLENKIETTKNKVEKANLTAIQDFSSIELNEKTQGLDVKEIYSRSLREGKSYLKVILFDHQDDGLNKKCVERLSEWCEKEKLHLENISKLKKVKIYRLSGADEVKIKSIAKHPSVRKVSFFPLYRIIVPLSAFKTDIEKKFPKPQEGADYPLVGVIDSGIPKDHPILAPWIIHQETFVPPNYQDPYHGSFVSGLVSMGNQFNGKEVCPEDEVIKILDLQIIPKPKMHSSDIGDTLTEDDLITRLQEAIPSLSSKFNIRIWNMSISKGQECQEEEFSDLAKILDELQEESEILFVIPSGNFEGEAQRTWPPPNSLTGDRLQIPGDSVKAITVGALTFKERADSVVRSYEPASYSCKGPGPSFIMKPELVHFSGNISKLKNGDIDFSKQGIVSTDAQGNLVEDVGTSFSTPLVARTLSLIEYNLADKPSLNLVKALAVHNASLPKKIGNMQKIFPYVGYGVPSSISNIFNCDEHEMTLIFEQGVYNGFTLDYPFGWPTSLKDENGKCNGKVRMTLVAQVPVDSNFGSEYIRANVSASLQRSKFNQRKNKEEWKGVIGEEPDNKKLKKVYGRKLIEQGFKWKPIKRYEKCIKKIEAKKWRIRVDLLLRNEFKQDPNKPINFALLFTISDPEEKAPVYTEVVQSLRDLNVLTELIQLRSQLRQKLRS
ncbi:S8 family peptidase [Candidatus Woesearchaeota archaeon]|nr:S8 family peptidase [Candidatus Woesearchaeota archaeon]